MVDHICLMPRWTLVFAITKKILPEHQSCLTGRSDYKICKGVFFYNFSLHNSLSQEAKLRDDFNNTLENIETQVKQRDSVIDVVCVMCSVYFVSGCGRNMDLKK